MMSKLSTGYKRQIAFKHFNEKQKNGGTSVMENNKSVLVKILIISKDESRDKIIKATNFQTAIPTASLKATEKFRGILKITLRPTIYFMIEEKIFIKTAENLQLK